MYPCLDVEGISVDRLLRAWKWLADRPFRLVAVNAFGDLFLEESDGTVCRLDVTGGTLSSIASSDREFRQAMNDAGNRNKYFLEGLSLQAEQRGLHPGKGQCIGYKVPPVFKESANTPNNAYVADLLEYISLMGALHCQIKNVPNGGAVKIRVEPRPQ